MEKGINNFKEHLGKLEVLTEIYTDLVSKNYSNKEERDTAKLKIQLVKKEIMLLNYLLKKDIDTLSG